MVWIEVVGELWKRNTGLQTGLQTKRGSCESFCVQRPKQGRGAWGQLSGKASETWLLGFRCWGGANRDPSVRLGCFVPEVHLFVWVAREARVSFGLGAMVLTLQDPFVQAFALRSHKQPFKQLLISLRRIWRTNCPMFFCGTNRQMGLSPKSGTL